MTQLVEAGQPFWLDVEDPADEVIDELAALLGLPPLAVEGSKRFGQRAKLQVSGNGVLLVGFGLPGENAHAPNERISLELIELGEASARELFRRLAQLGREL